jgi:hypothetical protein
MTKRILRLHNRANIHGILLIMLYRHVICIFVIVNVVGFCMPSP